MLNFRRSAVARLLPLVVALVLALHQPRPAWALSEAELNELSWPKDASYDQAKAPARPASYVASSSRQLGPLEAMLSDRIKALNLSQEKASLGGDDDDADFKSAAARASKDDDLELVVRDGKAPVGGGKSHKSSSNKISGDLAKARNLQYYGQSYGYSNNVNPAPLGYLQHQPGQQLAYPVLQAYQAAAAAGPYGQLLPPAAAVLADAAYRYGTPNGGQYGQRPQQQQHQAAAGLYQNPASSSTYELTDSRGGLHKSTRPGGGAGYSGYGASASGYGSGGGYASKYSPADYARLVVQYIQQNKYPGSSDQSSGGQQQPPPQSTSSSPSSPSPPPPSPAAPSGTPGSSGSTPAAVPPSSSDPSTSSDDSDIDDDGNGSGSDSDPTGGASGLVQQAGSQALPAGQEPVSSAVSQVTGGDNDGDSGGSALSPVTGDLPGVQDQLQSAAGSRSKPEPELLEKAKQLPAKVKDWIGGAKKVKDLVVAKKVKELVAKEKPPAKPVAKPVAKPAPKPLPPPPKPAALPKPGLKKPAAPAPVAVAAPAKLAKPAPSWPIADRVKELPEPTAVQQQQQLAPAAPEPVAEGPNAAEEPDEEEDQEDQEEEQDNGDTSQRQSNPLDALGAALGATGAEGTGSEGPDVSQAQIASQAQEIEQAPGLADPEDADESGGSPAAGQAELQGAPSEADVKLASPAEQQQQQQAAAPEEPTAPVASDSDSGAGSSAAQAQAQPQAQPQAQAQTEPSAASTGGQEASAPAPAAATINLGASPPLNGKLDLASSQPPLASSGSFDPMVQPKSAAAASKPAATSGAGPASTTTTTTGSSQQQQQQTPSSRASAAGNPLATVGQTLVSLADRNKMIGQANQQFLTKTVGAVGKLVPGNDMLLQQTGGVANMVLQNAGDLVNEPVKMLGTNLMQAASMRSLRASEGAARQAAKPVGAATAARQLAGREAARASGAQSKQPAGTASGQAAKAVAKS